MGKVTTIQLCRSCEKVHAGPLRAPVHLVDRDGTLRLLEITGEIICPTCRTRWKRKSAVRRR